jgi:Mn-dependent DtxR family transcriptional regulator
MCKKTVRVSDAARELDLPLPVTSQSLRALNSRGLLRAERSGREVLYRVGDDPALPETRVLLHALRFSLGKRGQSVEAAFHALTGFTHPCRIALVRSVARGAARVNDIRATVGVSRRAAIRHLDKLVRRGYLVRLDGGYGIARPAQRLSWSLLSLALSGP